MIKNHNIKLIFSSLIALSPLCGCVSPEPPRIPFNSDEVSWARKIGNSTIKGCVSGAEFTKYNTYKIPDGYYTSYPDIGSSVEHPQRSFTIDLLPESEYMHKLSKKMYIYSLRLHSYKNINDPRWVDSSIINFIPHFSCPDAGAAICTSAGHFIFSNLPAGTWYIVTGYNSTPEQRGHIALVQKIKTIEGQTVPFVSWVGALDKTCKP
ncbi:hypothetical protein LV564_18360 (plasmid) [Komagataeibacter nataicola]|uniref:Lipoprotein n=1 Tax=Komagataeibacter melomenusus TaxID=2766578 RepID=A0ABX2ABT1_9PROT|nr:MULTISPECIES: hypothetical protein [Komagataeibacter]MBV0889215.1 hypothetical protein [Komagataeibacter oboediens]MBV1830215.1 hypothetical protein [Komagataeibacter melomenusus]MCK9821211.1 hypothetical protein [Komagataeibacter oboediens]NPC65695.1 hypothetical protein [Komagataeibacter melomenusus]WEQ57537.1 hypothetical protein LV564_18360 [Komagataeibacter nataicola]